MLITSIILLYYMVQLIDDIKNKIKGTRINLSKRATDSIGNKVLNKIEIHYRGPPHNFMYNGPIDEISVEQFRAINSITVVELDNTQYQYPNEKGEKIEVNDNERIVDPMADKIRFYKLYSKKTIAIDYLATYDLDLIQSSSQVPYTDTAAGMKHLKNFQLILMFSAMIILNIILDSISASTYVQTYSPTPHNVIDYYIPLLVIVLSVFILYMQHIRDISHTMVHTMYLQGLPMKIINANGVLPVVLLDSQTSSVWTYLTRLLRINPGEAQKVIAALQEWKADQLETAFVNSKITEKNISLLKLQVEQRELHNTDIGMFIEHEKRARWFDMLVGGLVATFIAIVIIFTLL